MRSTGAMYMESYGATRTEIMGMGRWADSHTDCNSVMARSYLKNLPPGGLLAAAGFVAGRNNSMEYVLPRGRCIDVTDLVALTHDHDFAIVMDYLFPSCLENASRATQPSSFHSVSNVGLTRVIVASVASWVQDSVIMIKQYPALKQLEPYTYLFADRKVKAAYAKICQRVVSCINAPPIDLSRQMEYRDTLRYIDYVHSTTWNKISDLPKQFVNELKGAAIDFKDAVVEWVQQSVNTKDKSSMEDDETGIEGDTNIGHSHQNNDSDQSNSQDTSQGTATFKFTPFINKEIPILQIVHEWESLDKGDIKSVSFQQKERQEKEKRKLIFDTVKQISESKHITTVEAAKLFRNTVMEHEGVTMGDVEALCRKKKKQSDYDVLDENNIKEFISARKIKEKQRNDKRKEERRRPDSNSE